METQINSQIVNGFCLSNRHEEFMTSTRVADMLIAIAYFTIPLQMFYFGFRQKIKSSAVTWLFMAFIFSCGCTHFFQVFFNYITLVWILGVLKWITAIISVICAIAMLWELPRIAKLESSVNELKEQIFQFTGYIFHEIRVPMNSIVIGIDNVLSSKNLKGEDLDILKMVEASLRNVTNILNDILDIHKITKGKFTIEKDKVNLQQIITVAMNSHRSMAEHKKIKFEFTCEQNLLSKSIFVSETRLLQCINNLVSNAIKYTSYNGHVTIKIDYIQNEQLLMIAVEDDGVGISEENQQLLFKPYVQIDKTNCSEIGTGLGLVITKQIAKLHDGDVTVESKLEVGSTFTLTVKTELFDSIRQDVRKEYRATDDIKFLIVDDSESNCKLLSIFLKKKGIKSDYVRNGQAAVDLIKEIINSDEEEGRTMYDLIIMDKHMPIMDGIQATCLIRSLGLTMPIIGLSGISDEKEKERFMKSGINEILVKPLDFAYFDKLLSELLNPEGKNDPNLIKESNGD